MIHHLPTELLIHIFSFFTQRELCLQIAPVCSRWRQISKDSHFWKEVTIKETLHPDGQSVPSLSAYRQFFQQFSNLTTFTLHCMVNSALLIHPQICLPNLKNIHLIYSPIATGCPPWLANKWLEDLLQGLSSVAINLEFFHLVTETITVQQIKWICTFRRLRGIKIRIQEECPPLLIHECVEIISRQTKLQQVHLLLNNSEIPTRSIETLCRSHHTTLTHLSFYLYTNECFPAIGTCQKLKYVKLHLGSQIKEQELHGIKSILPHLEILKLIQCRFIPPETVMLFFKSMKKLTFLQLKQVILPLEILYYFLIHMKVPSTTSTTPLCPLFLFDECRFHFKNHQLIKLGVHGENVFYSIWCLKLLFPSLNIYRCDQ